MTISDAALPWVLGGSCLLAAAIGSLLALAAIAAERRWRRRIGNAPRDAEREQP